MAERITCTHVNGAGLECGRFLGEVVEGQVLIYCPACKTLHAMEITTLMRHLREFMDETETQAGKRQRKIVGFA